MWERIKLPENYAEALKKIDDNLEYWPKFLVHKSKQRLTKIHQYLIRTRKLQLKDKPELVAINKKRERRDAVRENKAMAAARLDQSIKKELLERLKKNIYGDIYSFPQKHFDEALDELEVEEDENQEIEFVEGSDVEEDEEFDIPDGFDIGTFFFFRSLSQPKYFVFLLFFLVIVNGNLFRGCGFRIW